jgi:hypothetical protein
MRQERYPGASCSQHMRYASGMPAGLPRDHMVLKDQHLQRALPCGRKQYVTGNASWSQLLATHAVRQRDARRPTKRLYGVEGPTLAEGIAL